MPTGLEISVAGNLREARFAAGSPDKRFVSSVRAMEDDELLTPKQHLYAVRCGWRYRRQIPSKWCLELCRKELDIYRGDREQWELELDATPEDWSLRRVYADWLDENGDNKLANAQRFLADCEQTYLIRPGGQSHGPNGTRGINYSWFWHWDENLDFSMTCGTWHETRAIAELSVAENLERLTAGSTT